MGYIIIDKVKNNNKKIMIFIEGVLLKPKHDNIFFRDNISTFVPILNARQKINKWQEEGYEIIYLTSFDRKGALKITTRIDDLGFDGSMVGYRENCQSYATLIKEEMPDILIDSTGNDDFFRLIDDNIKERVTHIRLNENEGIDNVKLY